MRVFKFGGTSMATPQSILRAVEIINAQGADVVVVSAPGKRWADDDKITDMLFDCHDAFLKSGRCDLPFLHVEKRITELSLGVGVTGIKPYLDQIRHDINAGAGAGYTVSRGEFLCALLMRHLLSAEFIDAREIIKFDINGKIDTELSYFKVAERLKGCGRAVIPGYYGAMPGGEIKVFSRGGSDVSGALIAAGADADEYQNWTDVDGVYFCPLTEICGVVPALSYRDMRQLAFLGGSVLHHDSLPPLMQKGIEIRVKNTFNPDAAGTLITNAEKAEFLRNKQAWEDKENGATDGATDGATNGATDGATNSAKGGATDSATDGATDSATDGAKDGAKDGATKYSGEKLPVAVSGRGGFRLLSFYAAGSADGGYMQRLLALCAQRGAKIFTAAAGVDGCEVVLSGETGRLKDCVNGQNIAVVTVLGGEKSFILSKICAAGRDVLFLQWTKEGGVILGVKEEELKAWLKFFCELRD